MATEIIGILDSMGAAQVTAILALVATLLILLIILAFRRRQNEAKVPVAQVQKDIINSGIEKGRRITEAQFKADEPSLEKRHESIIVEKIQPTTDKSEVHVESSRSPESLSPIPQDSVLRRHYLANAVAIQDVLHNPYPTDSVLRRHYDALHTLIVESSTAAIMETDIAVQSRPKASIIEQAIRKDTSTEKQQAPTVLARISLPQDSVLRRHFVTQLRAEIEANMSPKPSDSVLRRHYDSLVGVELEKRLTA